MPITNLEEEEEVIQNLEDLDHIFSNIRSTLRSIKTKISKIALSNKKLSDDCYSWIKFFESDISHTDISPISDLHLASLKFKECSGSPDFMNISSPKNPFMEINTSNLLNKSLMKENKSINGCDSSSTIQLNKSKYEAYESFVHCDSEESNSRLVPFDIEQIPEIFQQEGHLKELYEFIESKRTVSLEEICQKFENISAEKLKIFISLLSRKNFIRQKGSSLTIEK